MKIIITSDIHRNKEKLENLLKLHPDANYFLDAGDSEMINKELSNYNLMSVRGNMDSNFTLPFHRMFNIDNKKILLMHGHTVNVKASIVSLTDTAANLEADIIIFGHTHVPFMKVIDNILYLNPGSLGYDDTYIVLENGKARFLSI